MTAKSIFVISPIGASGSPEHRRYRLTLEYIVKKAFTAPDWTVVRADDEAAPDSITTQVIGRIIESDLVIADLSDHNPNVFYELAVAHGYQKPVIHMMEAGQKVPFDVVDQRVIFYDLADPESVDKAKKGLLASATWLDDNPGGTRNPLSAYGQFKAISSGGGDTDAGVAVADAIERLSRQISRLEARVRADGPRSVRTSTGISAHKYERELNLIERQIDDLKSRQAAGETVGDQILELLDRHARFQGLLHQALANDPEHRRDS